MTNKKDLFSLLSFIIMSIITTFDLGKFFKKCAYENKGFYMMYNKRCNPRKSDYIFLYVFF